MPTSPKWTAPQADATLAAPTVDPTEMSTWPRISTNAMPVARMARAEPVRDTLRRFSRLRSRGCLAKNQRIIAVRTMPRPYRATN